MTFSYFEFFWKLDSIFVDQQSFWFSVEIKSKRNFSRDFKCFQTWLPPGMCPGTMLPQPVNFEFTSFPLHSCPNGVSWTACNPALDSVKFDFCKPEPPASCGFCFLTTSCSWNSLYLLPPLIYLLCLLSCRSSCTVVSPRSFQQLMIDCKLLMLKLFSLSL
jgi:hypothetical protein